MLFYIRIELNRSNVDGRSFQTSTDKMLCFQGLYGFQRKRPPFPNYCETLENTGKTDFFGFADDSSQTVVTVVFVWIAAASWQRKFGGKVEPNYAFLSVSKISSQEFSIFRYLLGDTPSFSRKHFPKWLVCKNPTRFAISLIGASVLRSSSAALDRRYSVRY